MKSLQEEREAMVEEALVKHLVDRFLGWHLPKDFHPDSGISFEKEYNVSYNTNQGLPPDQHEPTGTNLFTAEQAKEMFRFLLENEDGTSFLRQALLSHEEKVVARVRERQIAEAVDLTKREIKHRVERYFKDAYLALKQQGGVHIHLEEIQEIIDDSTPPGFAPTPLQDK